METLLLIGVLLLLFLAGIGKIRPDDGLFRDHKPFFVSFLFTLFQAF